MIVTVLAVAFLIVIGFSAFLGYSTVIKRKGQAGDDTTETCAICRRRYEKSALIERQVGDYKLSYYCRPCVMKLYGDLGPVT